MVEDIGKSNGVKLLSTESLKKELLSDRFFIAIGKQLRACFPNVVVFVNQTLPSGKIIQLRYEEGLGGFVDAIVNRVGRRIEDMDFKGTEFALETMPSGKIYQLEDGFYQLALGEISRSVAAFIESILSINKIYAVAFVRNKIILGSIVLIFRHKEDLKSEYAIKLESYAKECSLLVEKMNAKKRILFLDDEESIRNMIVDMLYDEGVDIAVAATGKEAINSYKKKLRTGYKYDAVITDLNLRYGINGAQTAKEILGIDPDAKLILCTGNVADKLFVEYNNLGYRALLRKPFTIDEIKEAIQNATVDGRQ